MGLYWREQWHQGPFHFIWEWVICLLHLFHKLESESKVINCKKKPKRAIWFSLAFFWSNALWEWLHWNQMRTVRLLCPLWSMGEIHLLAQCLQKNSQSSVKWKLREWFVLEEANPREWQKRLWLSSLGHGYARSEAVYSPGCNVRLEKEQDIWNREQELSFCTILLCYLVFKKHNWVDMQQHSSSTWHFAQSKAKIIQKHSSSRDATRLGGKP